ncbi:uncharacterized protein LOC6599020 [Drosophila persimilis]|uniref:uncharacterized protein LOC6599020 n=1 Tax=Drosophila persimilis TaxID=7234 RepID=UPI000F07785C|nr:uncharacterized protein LOC6599020 [Drosophila persimilis]
MSDKLSILDVSVELISEIFEHLESAEDRLEVVAVHPKFAKGFARFAATAHRTLKCGQLPLSYCSKVLQLAGDSVKSLSLQDPANVVALMKLASDHCPNLEEISIPVRTEYWAVIQPLLLSMQKLKRIDLRNDFRPLEVIGTLLEFPQLEFLLLVGFRNDNLSRIDELQGLTSLHVINNEPIDVYLFFAPLKNLTELEVKVAYMNCPVQIAGDEYWPKVKELTLTFGIFRSEMPYLPSLWHLSISHVMPDRKISQLFASSVSQYAHTLGSMGMVYETQTAGTADAKIISELKSLRVLYMPYVNNAFIGALKSDSLERLFIRDSWNLTNSGILRLLRGCKNLRLIDFGGCKRITKHLVEPALKILKKNGVRPDNPVELRVNAEFGDHISHMDLTLMVISRGTADGKPDWIGDNLPRTSEDN